MGQGCSGVLSDGGTSAVVPSQTAALQLIATTAGSSKKSINWKVLYSSRINEIIDTLAADDLRLLLVSGTPY
jgi:hypothetical protein